MHVSCDDDVGLNVLRCWADILGTIPGTSQEFECGVYRNCIYACVMHILCNSEYHAFSSSIVAWSYPSFQSLKVAVYHYSQQQHCFTGFTFAIVFY